MSEYRPQHPRITEAGAADWRVVHLVTSPGSNPHIHYHDGYEFLLHLRNGGKYQLGQRVFPLRPYQLIVAKPNQPHGVIAEPNAEHYERLLVQVSPQVLSQLHFAGTSVKQIVERCCERLPLYTLLSPQDYVQVRAIASIIRPPEEATSPLERMEAMGALSVLLSRFCQALSDARLTENRLSQEALLQDVYNHILERFSEDCSLEALAERFNISKFHLSHRFTQTYGMSLHQFVLHCRMAYAQLLIRQGEPMMSIAYQCGFNDYSTFVRAFARFNGTTPRAWRKQQLLPLTQLPRL